MPNHCSPSKQAHNNINTCYDSSDLKAIAKAYNSYIKKNKLCYKNKCTISQPIDINSSDEYLYTELSKRLNALCQSDYCWTELDLINYIHDDNLRDSLLYFTFRPKGLPSKRTWFSTNNINEIIQQYQDLHKHRFKFLGAQPSDYTKLVKLDKKKLKNYKCLGIIFNTDPHTLPGKHWVSVFIDNVNKTVEYFDSLGKTPNKNIASFLKLFKEYDFTINKKIHQKGGSNCGVYSCYFIIQRLNGKTFDEINKKLIPDKIMTELRDILFRPYN